MRLEANVDEKRSTYRSVDDLSAHVNVVGIQDPLVVTLQNRPDILPVRVGQANCNFGPFTFLCDCLESAFFLYESMEGIEV